MCRFTVQKLTTLPRTAVKSPKSYEYPVFIGFVFHDNGTIYGGDAVRGDCTAAPPTPPGSSRYMCNVGERFVVPEPAYFLSATPNTGMRRWKTSSSEQAIGKLLGDGVAGKAWADGVELLDEDGARTTAGRCLDMDFY